MHSVNEMRILVSLYKNLEGYLAFFMVLPQRFLLQMAVRGGLMVTATDTRVSPRISRFLYEFYVEGKVIHGLNK
jgi:hypothetical protein